MTSSGGRQQTTTFRFVADAQTQGLEKFSRELDALGKRVKQVSDVDFRGLQQEILSTFAALDKSQRNIGATISALKTLQSAAQLGSKEFFELGDSIRQLDVQLKVAGQQGTIGQMGAALAGLKQRLSEVNLLTQEGRAEHAQLSAAVLATEREMKRLAGTYTNVATQAKAAARATTELSNAQRGLTALGTPIGPRMPAGATMVPPSPLALPAAGGTSFQGPVDSRGFGGGARGRVSDPIIPGQIMLDRAGRASIRGGNAYAGPEFGVGYGGGAGAPATRLPGFYYDDAYRLNRGLPTVGGATRAVGGVAAPPTPRFAFGAGAGAIAAGGFFGGPEGFVGSLAGLALGGPGAALAGATIGAGAGRFRQGAGGFAEQAAQLEKYRIALRDLIGDQAEYERAIGAIEDANQRLNIPLTEGTREFTKLAAAVIGAGGNVQDAELAFSAVNNAIKATGGNARDVEGALLAVTQVFSKGKVSAEELRRQLGDRLPGAVNRFAESMGVSTAELDKLLRTGQVGLGDFMKFLADLDRDFAGTAEKIAASNEDAGARLAAAWERARIKIGDTLRPLGAALQEELINVLEKLTPEIEGLIGELTKDPDDLKNAVEALGGAMSATLEITKLLLGPAKMLVGVMKDLAGPTAAFWSAVAGGLGGDGPIDTIGRTRASRGVIDATSSLSLPSLGPQRTARRVNRRGRVIAPPAAAVEARAAVASPTDLSIPRDAWPAGIPDPRRRQPSDTNWPDPADDDDGSGSGSGRSKAEREADQQARLQQRLAAENRKLAEQNAQNQRRLSLEVFNYQQELDERRYQNLRRLQELRSANEVAGLPAGQRRIGGIVAELRSNLAGLGDQARQDQARVAAAQQGLTVAQQYQATMAQFPVPTLSEAGMTPMAGGGYRGGASTGWTRDRDAEQSGFDVVLPGGRGAAIPSPVDLKITGTGFQGSGAGSGGRGYGNWVSGTFTGPDGKTYELLLGHLDKVNVGAGDMLSKGASIGTQGITGRTFGTHVTTHVNALQGGDPWSVLKNQIVQPWVSGWSGGSGSQGIPVTPYGGAAVSAQTQMMTAEADIERLKQQLNQAQEIEKLNTASRGKIANEFFVGAQTQALQPYRDRADAIKDELEALQLRNRLLLEGASPEVIQREERLLELRRSGGQALAVLRELLKDEKEKIKTATGDDLINSQKWIVFAENTIPKIEEGINAAAEGVRKMADEVERMNQPWAVLQQRINQLKDEAKDLTDPTLQAMSAAETISQSMGQAFQSIITGSQSVQEAVSQMLSNIAARFAQTAAEILTNNLTQGLLGGVQSGGGLGGFLGKIFGIAAPAIGGALGGGGLSVPFLGGAAASLGSAPLQGFSLGTSLLPGFASGGETAAGKPIKVGERGPELFVPFQKGSILSADRAERILTRPSFRAGTNSSGLDAPFLGGGASMGLEAPFLGGGDDMGLEAPFTRSSASGGSDDYSTNVIRFESKVIGKEEYVTRSEAEEIGRRAELRGAARVERRFKNDPRARAAAGI